MNTTKKLMTLLLALMGLSQAVAQDYEYVPFVREGVKWVYYYDNPIQGFSYEDGFIPYGEHYYTLEIKGDSVINGKTYKAMHLYSGHAINLECDTVPVYLREENRVVYGIIPDNRRYWECPIGIGTMVNGFELSSTVQTGVEFVLYDFDDPETFYSRYDYTYADTVQVGHQLRKRLHYTYEDEIIIEGLGYVGIIGMPLNYFYPISTGITQVVNHLSHVIEDGEIVYKTMWYKEIEPDDYLPIVREGVKWVYEKVIVDHGDTTRYYYNYEFSGEDDSIHANLMHEINKACYYYTGQQLNVETDSLIAGMLEKGSRVTCFRNNAYKKNLEEGKMLLEFDMFTDGGTILLYTFGYWGCDDYYFMLEYYQEQYGGIEPFLTDENFMKVSPIKIEGIECERYAYIGENGDTLAYVVEGIGFDSRDMGDLLTPFTRRPDPTADHQEWCGLSHVIKDGQIIYKGMCYRPYVPGDVNGDGEITIADAGSVIDVVVMGGNAGHTRTPAADVNNDGEVNIADVNAIIDLILSNR